MSAANMVVSVVLLASAALSLWLGLYIRRRFVGPGSMPLAWLLLAVTWWSLTTIGWDLTQSVPLSIVWSTAQFAGIAAVPPLWLLFVGEYTGAPWAHNRRVRGFFAWAAVAVMALVLTNPWHGWVWPSIEPRPGSFPVFAHGPGFWTPAVYHWALLFTGIWLLLRAIRQSRREFRGQLVPLLLAVALPVVANIFYLTGLTAPEGFDSTPVTFALSGALLTWVLYRRHLFDLIPVARDTMVDSLSDAVLVLDPVRRVLDLNTAARDLAGRPAEWFGRPVEELFPFLAQTPLGFTPGGPSTLTVTRGAEPAYYEVRVMPVRTRTERFAAWVVLLRDVSDQQRTEAERDAYAVHVQEQQNLESLSLLAAGLAHDLNNLLTGIVGNADLLGASLRQDGELRGYVGAIQQGAERAGDLVKKLLSLAGKRDSGFQRVDLDVLMRDLIDLLKASAARHCTLQYQGASAVIDGDPTQVRQVAMNLVVNAAEAVDREHGVVTVTIRVEDLTQAQLDDMNVSAVPGPGRFACLEVVDNGPGMDEATLRRVFTPFFTTKRTGHGLGLSAVEGIVRGHHGALRVDSAVGRGSRFSVWFPIAGREAG